jgi:hypothetical protein
VYVDFRPFALPVPRMSWPEPVSGAIPFASGAPILNVPFDLALALP